MKNISKTVWILSVVSLFTDTASEMLYPIMPIYLKSIGFSILLIGILEGIAEASAGLSKGYFGKASDHYGKRVPFVQLGYSLSAISKPLLAFFTNPFWVFFTRTLDRLGKGIRTGARDAILSAEATKETKGKVFGFHRSMDTLGAVLGPLLALIYLHFYPENYSTLFFLAFIPGVLAIISTLLLKEKKVVQNSANKNLSFFSFINYWSDSPKNYKKLSVGLLLFALFNSSDVFLLLKVKESLNSDQAVIGIYIFYNLVYAVFSFPLGILADKIGLKNIFMLGIVSFSIVYFGMALYNNLYFFCLMFFIYGIYAAATEGISKAWITNIVDKKDAATAVGTYSAFQSICALAASTFAGFIWFKYNSTVTFIITGIISVLVLVYFLIVFKNNKINKTITA